MSEITIELSDDVLEILDSICDSEGITWDEFVSIMVKYFNTACPYHIHTLESFLDFY